MSSEEGSTSYNPIDKEQEYEGAYKKEILIDKKKLKQIQKEDFSLSNYSGFKSNILERFGIKPRKHHLYYGLNIQENAIEINQSKNKLMIPLLAKADLDNKLRKIDSDIRKTLGWIHIGAIQIIIKATFREGLNTPIDLAIMDNRLINREEACLGILRGNLQYGKLKFNIYPRIAYNIKDKDFKKL